MINIVIYALGTGGDIDPMLALGTELVERGYNVSFLSNDYFKSSIAAECEFFSVGTLEHYHKGNSVSAWATTNHTDTFEHYHAPAFENAFDFVSNLSTSGTQSLLLALGDYTGAVAAAEKFNIPYIKIILSPNVIFSAYNPPAPMCWSIPSGIPKLVVRFLLRRNRKAKFLRFCKAPHTVEYRVTRKRLRCPLRFQKQSKALLQIALFPEWFASRSRDWPNNLQLVGFPLKNRSSISTRKRFDALIERLGTPVIFTSGTGVKDAIELFTEGRKICEKLRVAGIFVGGDQSAEALQGSALCAHISYIDFDYALPKSLAIIHHGGIGTSAQAIKAGIPQLIRPVKYDQPDNAHRIYQLGLGTYVMPEHFNVETVAPILSAMLHKAKNSKALSHYSAKVSSSLAIINACDLIEQTCNSLKAMRS